MRDRERLQLKAISDDLYPRLLDMGFEEIHRKYTPSYLQMDLYYTIPTRPHHFDIRMMFFSTEACVLHLESYNFLEDLQYNGVVSYSDHNFIDALLNKVQDLIKK